MGDILHSDVFRAAGAGNGPFRKRHRRVQRLLAEDPQLAARYHKLEQLLDGLVSSNYDISNSCNLRCEGCLFFSGDDFLAHTDRRSLAEFETFFRQEAQRGVNFAYFAGGEPALEQERLRLAQQYLPRGVVASNGTVRIADDIRYTIHVSLWGDAESTRLLRGGSAFQRALRNYRGDPRAIFVYTINHRNIDAIPGVAALCHAEGLRLAFSHFSATAQYRRQLLQNAPNDGAFFRFSTADNNLRLSDSDLLRAHDLLESVAGQYPESVLFSRHYNDWVSRPGPLYRIDPGTGLARDCPIRLSRTHRHFHVDLSESAGKCCSPNIDCSDCRAYAMALGTFRYRLPRCLHSAESFAGWLEVMELWCRLYLPEEHSASVKGIAVLTPDRSDRPASALTTAT